MQEEKAGLNDQNRAHHEGTQNNTVKANNNSTSHREMNPEQEHKSGTESDTANQADRDQDQPRQGNSSI